MSVHLFSPGPVEVSPETFRAMTRPMIGHRGSEFQELYGSVQPRLQTLFGTQDPVFLSTSSAWGVMEGALRNLARPGGKKVLTCMCGAFSDKWHDVAMRCGYEADKLQVEWGEAIKPEALREALSTGEYEVVTLVHNETSTGLMNPLPELAAVLREFPEVYSIVDTVSSFSALPIPKDELGLDVMLTGSQKALALPPGLALFSVSERALRRAEGTPGRGYYFDFVEFQKQHEKDMTPSTPVIPLIFALQYKLEEIFAEGIPQRHARHSRLNKKVHSWAERQGFALFPDPSYASVTLTTLRNDRGLDLKALNQALKERHELVINTGYGKIAGTTFRLSNMGDETDGTIDRLLNALDEELARLPQTA